MAHALNPATGKAEPRRVGFQSQPWLLTELRASLGYVGPFNSVLLPHGESEIFFSPLNVDVVIKL